MRVFNPFIKRAKKPRKPKQEIFWGTQKLDSEEELQFIWWLEEMKAAGQIEKWEYHPEEFELFPKIVGEHKKQGKKKELIGLVVLERKHTYTPDFKVTWTSDKFANIIYPPFLSPESPCVLPNYQPEKLFYSCRALISYFDVKGGYQAEHSKTEVFSIKKNMVLRKYGVYINKVVPHVNSGKKKKDVILPPVCLFSETFVPQAFMFTEKQRKVRVIHYKVKGIKEYVASL